MRGLIDGKTVQVDTGGNFSDFPTLPANLCPFSGCHECEGFDGEVRSSELHPGRKLTQTKYHRKMNSAVARAAIGSIWCGGTESEIKES